jgi:hypothetical protein
LDLALESTQPRAVAAQPVFTTGAGADRRSLSVSARAALLVFEVLMMHLMGNCWCDAGLENAGFAIVELEVAGWSASEDAVEDAFVHVEPPKNCNWVMKKAPAVSAGASKSIDDVLTA